MEVAPAPDGLFLGIYTQVPVIGSDSEANPPREGSLVRFRGMVRSKRLYCPSCDGVRIQTSLIERFNPEWADYASAPASTTAGRPEATICASLLPFQHTSLLHEKYMVGSSLQEALHLIQIQDTSFTCCWATPPDRWPTWRTQNTTTVVSSTRMAVGLRLSELELLQRAQQPSASAPKPWDRWPMCRSLDLGDGGGFGPFLNA
eukprot:1134761-Pelagomonas_calceolata.AAC.2